MSARWVLFLSEDDNGSPTLALRVIDFVILGDNLSIKLSMSFLQEAHTFPRIICVALDHRSCLSHSLTCDPRLGNSPCLHFRPTHSCDLKYPDTLDHNRHSS